MKRSLILFAILAVSCHGIGPGEKNSDNVEHELTQAESDSIGNAFYIRSKEVAKTAPRDLKIWLGYELGMTDTACDNWTDQLVKDGKIKRTGKELFHGMYTVNFGDTPIDVDIHSNSSGIFKKDALISFRSEENHKDPKKAVTDAASMVKWATKEFGSEPVVTLTLSFDEHMQKMYTKRYAWIHGSYTLDVVTIGDAATLTFRLTRLD